MNFVLFSNVYTYFLNLYLRGLGHRREGRTEG